MTEIQQVTTGCEAKAWSPVASLALVGCYFILFGILMSGQSVLWPEVMISLKVSEGVFGTAQLVSPSVAIVCLLLGGFWTETRGIRALVFVSLVFLAISSIAFGVQWNLVMFALALMIGGAGNGLMETAMNAATIDWERAAGKARMNVMHAAFSAGAIGGSMLVGAALSHGWSFRVIFACLAVPCAIVFLLTLLIKLPPAQKHEHDPHPLLTVRLILERRDLRRLAIIAVLGIVGESVAFVWAVIYLQQLGAPPMISGMAFAMFNAAMLLGRVANAVLVAKRGFKSSVVVSGIILMAAAGLLLSTRSVPLATTGFVLAGLGVAGIVPTVLARGAELAPGMSASVSGGIMAAAYIGFIACPPAIGWLAQATSLQWALASIGVSGAIMSLMVTLTNDVTAGSPSAS
jgi:predicted MFS family arabinose efflux permease